MLSRDNIIKRLNKEVEKSYKYKTIIVICFIIMSLFNIIFISHGKGVIIITYLIILLFLFHLVNVSVKRKIGIIYINNKFVCDNMRFFSKVDDSIIRCYMGIINVKKIEEMRIKSNNLKRNMGCIRDERGVHK